MESPPENTVPAGDARGSAPRYSASDEAAAPPRNSVDPWAHRRGEPRLFALLWSLYLFGAALTTVMQIPVLGASEIRFVRSHGQMLLLLIAIGLTLLWPLVRLSQARPRRPTVASLIDLLALLAPVQAVIWPLKWLGNWSWEVTAGVNGLLVSWSVLVGAFVALGTATRPGPARAAWMAVVTILVCGAPVAVGIGGLAGISAPAEVALGSPLTGVYALTFGEAGQSPHMTPAMWIAVSVPVIVAIPLWLFAPAYAESAQEHRRLQNAPDHSIGSEGSV